MTSFFTLVDYDYIIRLSFNTQRRIFMHKRFSFLAMAAVALIGMTSYSYAGPPKSSNDSNAIAGAIAGAAAISGSSSGASANVNLNNRNSNTNRNNNTNISSNKNVMGQQQGQVQDQAQRQSTKNSNNSDLSVNIAGDEAAKIPVSTAVGGQVGAAGGGNYQCLVPISMGGQGLSLGLSLGSATRDNDCVIFQTAAMVGNDPAIKTALMCQIPEYKEAMESIGRSCPASAKNDQVASAPRVWNQGNRAN